LPEAVKNGGKSAAAVKIYDAIEPREADC